ncbi:hypothetical protein LXL04_034518 [Taraxacum kok-saghyz]
MKNEHGLLVDQKQMKNHYFKAKYVAWVKLKNKTVKAEEVRAKTYTQQDRDRKKIEGKEEKKEHTFPVVAQETHENAKEAGGGVHDAKNGQSFQRCNFESPVEEMRNLFSLPTHTIFSGNMKPTKLHHTRLEHRFLVLSPNWRHPPFFDASRDKQHPTATFILFLIPLNFDRSKEQHHIKSHRSCEGF